MHASNCFLPLCVFFHEHGHLAKQIPLSLVKDIKTFTCNENVNICNDVIYVTTNAKKKPPNKQKTTQTNELGLVEGYSLCLVMRLIYSRYLKGELTT